MAAVIPNVLSIAGVDPSGGAGIFADIKTMSAVGCYGMGVVAALTAQNTSAVTGVVAVDPQFVTEQIDTLFADVRVDAVKIGMLSSPAVIEAVAAGLEKYRPRWVVLDPVMVAKSGDKLLEDDALEALRSRLLPMSHVVTPNLPEARVLLGRTIAVQDDMPCAARDLFSLAGGETAVYLKGGHLGGHAGADDLFYDGAELVALTAPRVSTKNTHGTGCTLSSAIASYLALTGDIKRACALAKSFISKAIARADELTVGHGHGPVHHFAAVWEKGLPS